MIHGTWDRVRELKAAAEGFERAKLFAQVMIGFELTALHKEHGVKAGQPKKELFHAETILSWEDVVQKEVGISKVTAWRYMEMAKAAAPRLKKLPLLKELNLLGTALDSYAEPQREALEKAVHKITDGKTQLEFMEALGTAKKLKGVTGGARESADKPDLTIDEELAIRTANAREDQTKIAVDLARFGPDFILLTDAENQIFLSYLETMAQALRKFLATPQKDRATTGQAIEKDLEETLQSPIRKP